MVPTQTSEIIQPSHFSFQKVINAILRTKEMDMDKQISFRQIIKRAMYNNAS